MATFKDFRNDVKPNWCPGCGDYSVQAAIQRASANIGIEPHQLALISGIGCSGRISGYFNAYGFHGIHGRSLPIAQGVKMGNRDLTVIAAGGDGDGFAIGTGHTVHAMRRNMNITYIVMDNQIYGLTKGQTSPTSQTGFVTKSTPTGNTEKSFSPMQIALTSGATFVAQSFSSDLKELTSIIEQAMKHKGFSIVNVFSPCVTFNKINTYEWYKEQLVDISGIKDYNPNNLSMALQTLIENNNLVKGVIYQDPTKPCYEESIHGFNEEGLAHTNHELTKEQFDGLLKRFI